jgi:TPR repeat protein
VGSFYLDGQIGLEADLSIAIEYFQMAALQGFQPSILNLAHIYCTGYGSQKPDFRKAKRFLDMVKKWENKEMEERADALRATIAEAGFSLSNDRCSVM